MGHSKGVRDICFSNDGRKFITASFDKYLKIWDTETGKNSLIQFILNIIY